MLSLGLLNEQIRTHCLLTHLCACEWSGILRGDVASGVAGTWDPPFLPSSLVKMYRKQGAFLHASLAGDMEILHHAML